jgi:predicted nucleic acid-binding protein
VILVDANTLIYASNEGASRHAQARDWLNDQLNNTNRALECLARVSAACDQYESVSTPIDDDARLATSLGLARL